MKIDINKLAKISMLDLQEAKQFEGEIQEMLEFMGGIEKFKQTKKASVKTEDFSNLRGDEVQSSLSFEETFLNAKSKRENYFVVPIVVD